MTFADAAASDPRLTSSATAPGQPNGRAADAGDGNAMRTRGSVFDLRNVVHATGRFLDLFEERRRAQAARRPTAPRATAPLADPPAPARQQKPPPNPFHQNLRAGVKAGLIPPALGRLLVLMTGNDTNPAVRAEAAARAAYALNEIEGRAFQANTHLRLEEAQTKQLAASTARFNAANAEVVALLAAVYRDPAAAAANLRKHLEMRPGPGTVAQEVRDEPALLGDLRGGFLFKRAERRDALAAVGKLVAAIEQRGRAQADCGKDRDALADHKAAPSRDANLADALKAFRHLTAVQAAIPPEIASDYPDGLTTMVLLDLSQTLSERVSPADLADPAVTGLHPAFRARLADQMQRMGDLQALLAGNTPARAVDTFHAAAHIKDANIDAAKRLQQEGQIYPAQRAAEWATIADTTMREAAKAIMGSYDHTADAQQRGLMPYVIAVQQGQASPDPAQTLAPHVADLAFDGPGMG
ncbi:BID domain-containing protein [Azospirillum canadense]|uniref:BID domain-containing protein n=1 Tax=Azospirillum canadense TaxID=403962 RepID=UPI002227D774|nr:BID domain-containing protein [Azospirillum canadense]MCW2240719.1 hypothetical protein [Azospirillum canadense]